ncbi:transglutaminaseTgpA domain-containing protein [Vulgatibacter incomptus]|uniref:Transglutaminase-like enzyme, putative cysteine protease n=1 Tax=Vulgatibacter incomptus TaxID=1391653 RepID=A0A0K1P9C2_9BACT|nr:transglutaminaseTgpA domain-containing protein [Vulgatibacter incomptus]AKU90107.1 Transglutaminase-like enzyme, putative cysteine protease [Vulgatibacter incomptus]
MLSWARLRATARLWWHLMRMQRVTRDGWFYVGFTVVVGAAAINTGNNLLHLVLGLQLSLIVLSALLSESALRGVAVERSLPRNGVAGEPFEVRLAVTNRKRRLASHALVISEVEGPAAGMRRFVSRIAPGGEARLSYRLMIPRRGDAELGAIRITTRFPFGLFEKSRELRLPQALPIHPPGLRAPRASARTSSGAGELPEPRPGQGAEFHALRELRPGDDPRQVHWRSTARTGSPRVIERERERRRRVTLLVDTRGATRHEELDEAAESSLALARRHLRAGCEVGIAWPGGSVEPGLGAAHLQRLGDAAARLGPGSANAPAPRAHRGAQAVEVPIVLTRGVGREGPRIEDEPGRLAQAHKGPSLHVFQRASLLAASLAAFGSLAVSGELAGWAAAIFAGAAALGLVVREGGAERFRLGANVLALGTLGVLALQVFTGATSIIVAAPTFAVVLAASRLLGRKGPTDDALLLLAALLMLAGGAALTGELSYGLFFAAFSIAGTVALCLTLLRREVEAVDGAGASRRRGTVSGALIGALGALSLAVLGGSALVFVLFPRVSAGLVRHGAGHARVGGGADRIELGGVGVLKDDPTPAMRVRFPEGAPAGEVYWRTTTFQRWDGRGWSRGGSSRQPVAGGGGLYLLGQARRASVQAEVELLASEPGLPTPGEPLEVRFPTDPRRPAPLLLEGVDGTLEVAGGMESRYTIRAALPGGRAAGRSRAIGARDERELAAYLEVPSALDPRIVALAGSFDEGDPRELADSIVSRLGEELRYTRELPGETRDPLANFLFERKQGHCEYFASALAILLRLKGVPARVATGYYGASRVDGSDYWIVRQGDAHAWTEAWIADAGWVRFDATPATDRSGTADGVVARLWELVDRLRYRWGSWVLDFDRGSQRELAESVAEALAARQGAGRSLTPAARFGVVALCLGLAAWLLFRFRQRMREPGVEIPSAHHREALRLVRAVKRELGRHGVRLHPSASGAEWVDAAARDFPEKHGAVEAAVAAYEAARFGNRALTRADATRLRRALRGR